MGVFRPETIGPAPAGRSASARRPPTVFFVLAMQSAERAAEKSRRRALQEGDRGGAVLRSDPTHSRPRRVLPDRQAEGDTTMAAAPVSGLQESAAGLGMTCQLARCAWALAAGPERPQRVRAVAPSLLATSLAAGSKWLSPGTRRITLPSEANRTFQLTPVASVMQARTRAARFLAFIRPVDTADDEARPRRGGFRRNARCPST